MYQCLLPCDVLPFSCDFMQLALIKSHLGAFDSKVPVSPLSNLYVAQSRAKAKSKTSPPSVISILFLSEITSCTKTWRSKLHSQNTPQPLSGQVPLCQTICISALRLLILCVDIQV